MQPASAYATFWRWFRANGERLRAAMYGPDDDPRQKAADELRRAVARFDPPPNLEIGRGPDQEPGLLVVSADGRPERVDAVKDFVASAPELPGWEVVAFRPRMEIGDSIEIVLQGERIGPDDVWFRVEETDDGLELTLHVRGLNRQNERVRGLGASLLAEHAIGEHDALTMLSSLRMVPLPADPAAVGLHPFRELVGVFDAARAQKYPSPGSLPIGPESQWAGLRGTNHGKPILVLLNTGLRRLAGHPDYDHSLTVTVPFNSPGPEGLPGSEEYAEVGEIGDRITQALEQGQESILAFTVMTDGRRQLGFYTSNAASALRRIEPIRASVSSHTIEATAERDTFWGGYRQFLDAASQASEPPPPERHDDNADKYS